MDAQTAAALIASRPQLKAGSLRFYGEWFGKPYDNCHRIVGCRTANEALILEFDGGEKLTVKDLDGLNIGPEVFVIRNAATIRWEWFYYGRPQSPENLYFYEFIQSGSTIRATTNVDWYQPNLSPSSDENAIEIL